MKSSSLVIWVILLSGIAGLALLKTKLSSTAATPPPVSETIPATEPATTPSAPVETTPPIPVAANPPQPVASTLAVETKNDPAPIIKAVDALLTAKSGPEKHELFQQLIKSGQLDQAMAELSRRAAEHPDDPLLPTTLGEAQLNKIRALHESGTADPNDLGILAMQADKNFNAALKIDPKNWEAQFVKAASMYYWPADTTRDNAAAQQLSSLIDQQEGQPPRPEFAQPYIVLGNQYQKMGQPEKAAATWQLGLQKFPGDAALQKKVANAPQP